MELPLTSILKVARHARRLTQKTLWSSRKIIPLHSSDICDSLRLVCSHQTVKTNTSQTHSRTQLPLASAPLIKMEIADGTSSILKPQSVAQIMLQENNSKKMLCKAGQGEDHWDNKWALGSTRRAGFTQWVKRLEIAPYHPVLCGRVVTSGEEE